MDNDPTLPLLAQAAVAYARAGADVIAPSDMMDGRIGDIRRALDREGHTSAAIVSYAAKYASAFYGPFRDAAGSTPQSGDRRGYQMDPPNVREAVREAVADVDEGADMVMVKPGLPYLDVIRAIRERVDVPVVAYQVSGEFAMLHAAADRGWVDLPRAMIETSIALRRAGADLLITYFARDIAATLHAGRPPRGPPGDPSMSSAMAPTRTWLERARAITPGGVHSPVRAFAAVQTEPIAIVSARGALRHRRARPRVSRFHRRLGSRPARPRPPGSGTGGDRRGAARHGLRPRLAARSRSRRAHRRARAGLPDDPLRRSPAPRRR